MWNWTFLAWSRWNQIARVLSLTLTVYRKSLFWWHNLYINISSFHFAFFQAELLGTIMFSSFLTGYAHYEDSNTFDQPPFNLSKILVCNIFSKCASTSNACSFSLEESTQTCFAFSLFDFIDTLQFHEIHQGHAPVTSGYLFIYFFIGVSAVLFQQCGSVKALGSSGEAVTQAGSQQQHSNIKHLIWPFRDPTGDSLSFHP